MERILAVNFDLFGLFAKFTKRVLKFFVSISRLRNSMNQSRLLSKKEWLFYKNKEAVLGHSAYSIYKNRAFRRILRAKIAEI